MWTQFLLCRLHGPETLIPLVSYFSLISKIQTSKRKNRTVLGTTRGVGPRGQGALRIRAPPGGGVSLRNTNDELTTWHKEKVAYAVHSVS